MAYYFDIQQLQTPIKELISFPTANIYFLTKISFSRCFLTSVEPLIAKDWNHTRDVSYVKPGPPLLPLLRLFLSSFVWSGSQCDYSSTQQLDVMFVFSFCERSEIIKIKWKILEKVEMETKNVRLQQYTQCKLLRVPNITFTLKLDLHRVTAEALAVVNRCTFC